MGWMWNWKGGAATTVDGEKPPLIPRSLSQGGGILYKAQRDKIRDVPIETFALHERWRTLESVQEVLANVRREAKADRNEGEHIDHSKEATESILW